MDNPGDVHHAEALRLAEELAARLGRENPNYGVVSKYERLRGPLGTVTTTVEVRAGSLTATITETLRAAHQ